MCKQHRDLILRLHRQRLTLAMNLVAATDEAQGIRVAHDRVTQVHQCHLQYQLCDYTRADPHQLCIAWKTAEFSITVGSDVQIDSNSCTPADWFLNRIVRGSEAETARRDGRRGDSCSGPARICRWLAPARRRWRAVRRTRARATPRARISRTERLTAPLMWMRLLRRPKNKLLWQATDTQIDHVRRGARA